MAKKITYTDKQQSQSLPAISTNKKWTFQNANEVKNVINEHFERLALDWSADIVANDTIAVGQPLFYNDGSGKKLYVCNTSYSVGAGKTFTLSNFDLISGGGTSAVQIAYNSELTFSNVEAYAVHTLTANDTYSLAASGHLAGNAIKIITHTLNPNNLYTPIFPSSFIYKEVDAWSTANIMRVFFTYDGTRVTYSYEQLEAVPVVDTTAPTLSNFRILNANPDRVYFDSSEAITASTFAGFTFASPSKTVSSLNIVADATTGHYFVVGSAYVYGESPTVAYDGTDDWQDIAGNALASFTATAITNNVETTLAAPTIDSAVADSSSQITVNWTDIESTPDETGYELQYDTANTFDVSPQTITLAADAITRAVTGLTGSTTYYFRLRRINSNSLVNDSAWSAIVSQATAAGGDTTAPVATFSPTDGSTDININTNIVISFDEAILNTDGTEVTTTNVSSLLTFKLTDAAGADVAYTASINLDKTQITITPDSALSNSQQYYVAVNNFEDTAGNEQTTAVSATFTTAAAVFSPTIQSVESEYLFDIITFSEPVYGDAGATAAIEAADLQIVDFVQNGGGTSAISISSIQTEALGTVGAGATKIRVNKTITGDATGVETYRYAAANGTSIYDADGNAMDALHRSENINLKPYILLHEPFTGTTIDVGNIWTLDDPADGVDVTQNDELIFTADPASPVASTLTNKVLSKSPYQIDNVGVLQFTVGGTAVKHAIAVSLASDDVQDQVVFGTDVNNALYFDVWVAGVKVYNETAITSPSPNNTFRIIIDSQDGIHLEYLSGVDTWTLIRNTTQSLQTGLKVRIGCDSNSNESGIATRTVDDVYIVNTDYSTSTP